jgi:hypothetical protein
MADPVPARSDPRWKELLSGEREPEFSSLATKLMVARLRQTVRADPGSMAAAIEELFHFFTVNDFAQRDLAKL